MKIAVCKVITAIALILTVFTASSKEPYSGLPLTATSSNSILPEQSSSGLLNALYSRLVPEGLSSDQVFSRQISFEFDSDSFNPEYLDNACAVAALDSFIAQTGLVIDGISIISLTSPEGNTRHNIELASDRCKSTRAFLTGRYPDYEIISQDWSDSSWDILHELVSNDRLMGERSRRATLDVLESDCTNEARQKKMTKVPDYGYIYRNLYPLLRISKIDVYYHEVEDTVQKTVVLTANTEPVTVSELTASPEPVIETEPAPEPESPKHGFPPMAIKSNMLADVAGAFNAELEIPVGPRFSIAAEWMAPWWLASDNSFCYEANSMTFEGRYWLGDRQARPMLDGWFASVYVNSGRYDLQNSKRGIQGEFWNVGAGAGYSWHFGNNWALETMLGLGYLNTTYKQYEPVENYTILAYRRTLGTQWIGPTRLKLSLVYKLGQKTYNRKYRNLAK